MATQKQFDFDSYNKVMKNANSGLKLYLAEQMLLDVQSIMVRFKSPLVEDMAQLTLDMQALRINNKKYLNSRQKAVEDDKRDNTTSGDVDNANLPSETPKMVADYTNKHGDKPADYRVIAETLGDAPV